jgi:urease accessory protein
VAEGLVDGGAELEALLAAHRRLSLGRGDAALVRTAWRAASVRDAKALRGAAALELAARPAPTQREAALAVGAGLLRAARAAAADAEPERVGWIDEALAGRTPRAVVFGAVSHAFDVGGEQAAEGYVYTVLSGMVGAAVRLGRIGAADGQGILRRICSGGGEAAREPGAGAEDYEGDPAWFSPLLDVAAMRHELLDVRLFAS